MKIKKKFALDKKFETSNINEEIICGRIFEIYLMIHSVSLYTEIKNYVTRIVSIHLAVFYEIHPWLSIRRCDTIKELDKIDMCYSYFIARFDATRLFLHHRPKITEIVDQNSENLQASNK